MKLIKLTDYLTEDKIYINSNCILSCERLYNDEFKIWYTKVGLLYQNEFKFFIVKETIEDIQSQLEDKPTDKNTVGIRIKDIRLEKGMTLAEFGKIFGATKGNVKAWEKGRTLPNKERLRKIADLAGMTVQGLLEGN